VTTRDTSSDPPQPRRFEKKRNTEAGSLATGQRRRLLPVGCEAKPERFLRHTRSSSTRSARPRHDLVPDAGRAPGCRAHPPGTRPQGVRRGRKPPHRRHDYPMVRHSNLVTRERGRHTE
jgi:hypothetical protein